MIENPVFIIGSARSGTKFLRDQIAKDVAYNCVPYDVNYIWRMFDPGREDDVLDPAMLDAGKIRKIRSALFKLSGVTSSGQARMIEKSVSNCLRIPFIESVFPDAHYVHLVRDGRSVVESARRLWQAPPDKQGLMRKLKDLPFSQYGYLGWFAINYLKGLTHGRAGGAVWGPRYPGVSQDVVTEDLLSVVTHQWRACVSYALRDLENVPEDRKFFVQFEDLFGKSEKVEALCDFLKLSNKDAVVNSIRSGFESSNLEKWRDVLTVDDLQLIEKIAGDELRDLGYLLR